MTQQTAVEWFNQQLVDRQNGKGDSRSWNEILQQAKEIEKEQIIDAANITMEQRLLVDPIYKDCGEQYYNETYKL
jgi:hypothetical protein